MFRNLRIATRLGASFAMLVAVALALAFYGRWALGDVGTALRSVMEDRMVKVGQLRDVKDNLNITARAVRNIVLIDNDTAALEAEKKRIDAARLLNSALFKKQEESATSDKGRALLKELAERRAGYSALVDKAVTLGLANKDDEAREVLLKEIRPVQSAYFKALDDLIALQTESMDTSKKDALDLVERAGFTLVLLALLAGVASAAIAWAAARSITLPLREAVDVARRIADGDLSREVVVRSRDETGRLLAAMRDMQGGLLRVVGQVRGNADSVATASVQIAQGNQNLSQRTEEQASALEQTAATMEQLNITVRNNAESAKQAHRLAQGASDVAARGGEAVGQVVTTMRGISDSSRKIADIIGVIDGIAFQTNILALNAAVEAARAGEEGRGFAVVAGEVRTLAQRSAQAAKEIKGLIGRSVEQVEQGSVLVDRAGQTMGEIVGSIRRVSDIVSEISTASEQQSAGISQVGDAVGQMDQVTQQNAALVEESAAAAESLRGQAEELVQVVAAFRL
jgi:methyl-accepting chemotaxis protein